MALPPRAPGPAAAQPNGRSIIDWWDEAEAVLSYGRSEWPVWVHHAHLEQHWRVLEIIEPDALAVRPADAHRHILLVDSPFAYLEGRDGEQYITATRRGDRWWIKPNTAVNPRRGSSPGD